MIIKTSQHFDIPAISLHSSQMYFIPLFGDWIHVSRQKSFSIGTSAKFPSLVLSKIFWAILSALVIDKTIISNRTIFSCISSSPSESQETDVVRNSPKNVLRGRFVPSSFSPVRKEKDPTLPVVKHHERFSHQNWDLKGFSVRFHHSLLRFESITPASSRTLAFSVHPDFRLAPGSSVPQFASLPR